MSSKSRLVQTSIFNYQLTTAPKTLLNISVPVIVGGIFFSSMLKTQDSAYSFIAALAFVLVILLNMLVKLSLTKKLKLNVEQISIYAFGTIFRLEDVSKNKLFFYVLPIVFNFFLALFAFSLISEEVTPEKLANDYSSFSLTSVFLLDFSWFSLLLIFINLIPLYPFDSFFIINNLIRRKSLERKTIIFSLLIVFIFLSFTPLLFSLPLSICLIVGSYLSIKKLQHVSVSEKTKDYPLIDFVVTDQECHTLSEPLALSSVIEKVIKSHSEYFLITRNSETYSVLNKVEIMKAFAKDTSMTLADVLLDHHELYPKIQLNQTVGQVFDALEKENSQLALVYSQKKMIGFIDLHNINELLTFKSLKDSIL